jgi:hypothetical protein
MILPRIVGRLSIIIILVVSFYDVIFLFNKEYSNVKNIYLFNGVIKFLVVKFATIFLCHFCLVQKRWRGGERF